MQPSKRWLEIFGEAIIQSLVLAAFTILITSLDGILSFALREVFINVLTGLWFLHISLPFLFNTVQSMSDWRNYVLKVHALGLLTFYSSRVNYGLTMFCGAFFLFEKVIRQFFVYLQTEGPPDNEKFKYEQMKSLMIDYVGFATFLIYFRTLCVVSWRIVWILSPYVCAVLLFWKGWIHTNVATERRKNFEIRIFSAFVRLVRFWIYCADQREMIEAMVLFWVPQLTFRSCEWIERKWVERRNHTAQFDYLSCPIDKREIRLLRLKQRGIFSGLIRAEIEAVSLDNPPPYEALSYCWGTSTVKKPILVNGKLFWAFPAAHSLLYARSSYFKDQLLWIDAICINQGSDEASLKERSSQVRMMRQIYEKATRVVVWPGDTPRSRPASAMIYHFYSTPFSYEISPEEYKQMMADELYSSRVLAMVELLKTPYFSRVVSCDIQFLV